jgi:hypothetical protein
VIDIEARLGMIILLPDAMVTRAWRPIWQRLQVLGLDIVAVGAQQLRPHQMTELYAGSAVKPHNRARPPAGWLPYQLAALDMSIPVVLRAHAPIDLSRVLDQWKGPSRYGDRDPGDLRSVSRSSDRCLSLLHTCDNVSELARDLTLLFGAETADAIRQDMCTSLPADVPLLLRDYLPAEEEPHPLDIVLRSLSRALALLAYDRRMGHPPAAGTVEALRAVRTLRAEASNWSPSELIDRLAAGLAGLRPLLPGPAAANDRDDPVIQFRRACLVALLPKLSDIDRWEPEVAAELVGAFEASGLYLDGWERHRVQAALSLTGHSKPAKIPTTHHHVTGWS